jgi:hypothetical protein
MDEQLPRRMTIEEAAASFNCSTHVLFDMIATSELDWDMEGKNNDKYMIIILNKPIEEYRESVQRSSQAVTNRGQVVPPAREFATLPPTPEPIVYPVLGQERRQGKRKATTPKPPKDPKPPEISSKHPRIVRKVESPVEPLITNLPVNDRPWVTVMETAAMLNMAVWQVTNLLQSRRLKRGRLKDGREVVMKHSLNEYISRTHK